MVLLCVNTDPVAASTDRSGESEELKCASIRRAANSLASYGPHRSFSIEAFEFLLPIGFESDRDEATRLLTDLLRQIDLAEPFGRIEEAIREAQRLGSRGAEAHDQAA